MSDLSASPKFRIRLGRIRLIEIELQRMITMLTEAARRVAERVDDALWRSVPSELAA
jgi:hypothetical protein